MLSFLVRRTLTGLATLFTAIFLMFLLVNRAVDPLDDLRQSTALNKEQLIAQRIDQLDLNTPVVIRFFKWLWNFVQGDPGVAWRSGEPVGPLIAHAIGSTLQLVTAATFLALVLGVTVGIVSALRQYSTFDYLIIFLSFLLYSLPSFWVAVLLKQWAAIGFNDFLADAFIPWPVVAAISAVAGVLWMFAIGGTARRRVQTFLLGAAATFAMLAYLQLTDWWQNPTVGPVLLAVVGTAIAFAVAGIGAGLRNRRALFSALTAVALGVVLYFPMQSFFALPMFGTNGSVTATLMIFGLAAVSIVVGLGIGWLFAGPDRGISMRTAAITSFLVAALIFIDQVMQVWGPYSNYLRGRPIPTFGDRTPNIGGNYWVGVLDSYTHLILPTLTLILIAFAAYTRYSRSSMLEVMGQDYIRTARAKGLPERVVVVRHAFRNTLIPLATIVPIDVITLIGGAIITEAVFARPGMGQLFIQSLGGAEVEPVMAYLVITATLAILANIIADIIYAAVDPRIRLEA
ncbi:ABC transporter permease [Actinotalea sp. M2MS4P-6]|uniref:ABC transporter permease n=1 Tax=Actinotalea sp. M2MS4P-6 TaxID=2983762 RepID=UPI0021E4FBB2|nr:ABC transporter permease [Actinotalea sp. M2MS4P-6]MCV2396412.1 ABC transporter permease [Actinotalea sp. M2MS4P-6]